MPPAFAKLNLGSVPLHPFEAGEGIAQQRLGVRM
jgi:hypothetical protein